MSRGSAIWIATTCHQTSLIRTQTLSALGLSVLCLPQPSCPSAMSFHIFLNSHLPPFTSYCELKQAQTRRCACLQAYALFIGSPTRLSGVSTPPYLVHEISLHRISERQPLHFPTTMLFIIIDFWAADANVSWKCPCMFTRYILRFVRPARR